MKQFLKFIPILISMLFSLIILTFPKAELIADTAEKIIDKKPSIQFLEPIFDFGSVYQGEDVTHAFKFQNVGDDTLKINQVQASCGCSKAEAFTKEIAPGEFGEIGVTFKTAGFEGQQTKVIYVYSNDPLNPTTGLKLTGNVKLEVEIKPRHLILKDIPKYTQVTRKLEIIQKGEQELLIDKVTSDKKYIKIDSVDKKVGRGKNIYTVSVTVTGDAPVGNLSDRIEVSTNLKRQKRILIGVQGKILGDIKLAPERITFRMQPGGKRIFPVILSTKGDNFEVLRVENNIKHLSTEVVTLEKLRKYRIDFSIDENAPSGPITGNVKIYTNCPRETELTIPVFGWVNKKTIEIGYFFERGCLKCEHVHPILESLKEEFSNVVLKEYDIETRENMKLNETLCEIYGVPEEQRMITPAIFIGKPARPDQREARLLRSGQAGGDFLVGESVTKEKLIELINKYKDGASLPLEEITQIGDVAEESILNRFRSFGIFTIIGAGLLDGVNPCAFATIIFFISYLTLLKRKGKEIVIVGAVFTAAVFITYFLIGIGIFEFLSYLTFLKTFTKFVYGVMALLTLILGIFSLYDYFKCKRGKAKEILLQLPTFLKNRIHFTIKEHAGLKRYVLAAFVTGFIVSILELSCTGQVYLPTIVYATGISNIRFNAYGYLLLYNLMFILPLIVIFILAYLGATSIRLGDILGKNIALIKLLTSILFFVFTAFLLMILIV